MPALNKDDGPRTSGGYARTISYGALFVVCAVALGLIVGHDTAQFLGNRVIKSLYDDEGEGIKDPEYDRAEQELGQWQSSPGHRHDARLFERESSRTARRTGLLRFTKRT